MDDQRSVQPSVELHLPSKSSFCCSKDTEGWHLASAAGTQEDWAARETEDIQVKVQLRPCSWGFWRTVCIVFECVSVCSSDGSHGLQGFPDALTQKPNQIYPKMFALTMRRGVTLSTLYTMRRWHSHTRTLTHTAGFIYKLCFLLGTQQVQCLSLNCLELWTSAWVLWWWWLGKGVYLIYKDHEWLDV